MSILWCGGEDIDFTTTGTGQGVDTTSTKFRPTYARCAVTSPNVNNSNSRTAPFPAGSVTSAWLTVRIFNGAQATSFKNIGFRDSSTGGCLILGTNSSTATKLALYKYDGTTATQLAAESGTSLSNGAVDWLVMQVSNYGASSIVNVWVNGILVITFSGDCTVSSATSVNSVILCGNTTFQNRVSEIIVADVDVRSFVGLMTLALTGAGTTNSWTNPTFSNINGTTFSDANPTSSNTTAQDNEYNVTDLPSGTFQVLAVKSTMRAAVSSSPAVTQIKMGYKNGASVGFGTGAAKTPGVAYGTFEQLDLTDPTTSAAWLQADINGLQLDYQSLT